LNLLTELLQHWLAQLLPNNMDEAHLQTILAALSSDSLVASYVVFFLLLILCGSWMLASSQFLCTVVLGFLLHSYTFFFLIGS
jgi:hypothetical protein